MIGGEMEKKERARWMSVLARAPQAELERAWDDLHPKPDYDFLRRPETGLVMVRGRIGGTGRPFNLGEMTVTRCTVRLANGYVGHAYAAGRSHRHTELAAVFDALLQYPCSGPVVLDSVIGPLEKAEADRRRARNLKTAETKVDFFTMVRGDD
jgi:alpha-D-ribose 1-methylphosphonate 5-triphosphate synthase subunit PhnG